MPRDPLRSGPPTEAFVARFGAEVRAVPASRRNFVEWLHAADIDGEAIDDLEVAFSELAANAVAASPTTSHGVQIWARIDGGMLVLEVANHTRHPDEVPVYPPDLEDGLRPSGRGLLITRALVDSVDIESTKPGHLVVRCCRRLLAPP